MDNRVRDLDQIQEDEGDDRARRLGTILMAAVAIVGLSLALGVVVGRAAEPAAKLEDPLAKLERATASSGAAPSTSAKPAAAATVVEPADLTFPAALAEDEDRPEVLAALKAAEAEEASLGQPETTHVAVAAPEPKPPAVTANADDDSSEDDAPAASEPAVRAAPEKVTTAQMVASIPAAAAASGGARSLRKVVERDPLVAAAIHNDDPKASAPHGHDGEFTLQVISYDRPEPSRAFAEGLRAKGHMAFVVAADVPDRGRYFRVRVGPFKTRELADAYRHKFEDQEHMNTFVVRDKDLAAN
jgi:DedD protein